MKVVFFGTPRFSAEILQDLIEKGVQVSAVVTQPDKVQGRNLKYQESAVKKKARELIPEVPLLQPKRVRDEAFIRSIGEIEADFYVVVAFGQIFPVELLEKPPYGCINVHTSLLPKYRGAAPIQRCLIEGEEETGVAIMYMAEKCDAGDVLALKRLKLSPDITAGELTIELCDLAKQVLHKTLKKVLDGTATPEAQDESEVTFAKKVTPETAEIMWDCDSQTLYNLFRGVTPKPGAWCRVWVRGKEQRLKILKMKMDELKGSPGEILQYDKEGIVLGCKEGSISLLELQLEGKKALEAHSFIRGCPLSNISFKEATMG